jgi:excisionase family DNA binding protein
MTLPPTLPVNAPDYSRERYDVRAAAEYLAIPVGSLYRETAAGTIACRRTGRALRFSQADLDAWRQAHRSPVQPASFAPAGLPRPRLRRFA